jgi:hypothetical protein
MFRSMSFIAGENRLYPFFHCCCSHARPCLPARSAAQKEGYFTTSSATTCVCTTSEAGKGKPSP